MKIHERFDAEVKEIQQSLPFTSDSSTWLGYLASSIEQVANARSIFMDDVRHLTTLILAIFVGAAIIAAQAISLPIVESIVLLTAAIGIILFVFPVANAAEAKSRAAYEFYVASSIHAALVHSAAGVTKSHQWFCHVHRNMREIRNCQDEDWKTKLIQQWMKSSSATDQDAGNLYISYNRLLSNARIAAKSAVAFGLVFGLTHLSIHLYEKTGQLPKNECLDEQKTTPANTTYIGPVTNINICPPKEPAAAIANETLRMK